MSLLIIISICSCSGTKGLKDTDIRFSGTEVKFIDRHNISDGNTLKKEVQLSFLNTKTNLVFKKSLIRKTESRLENLLIGSGYLKSKTYCYPYGEKRKVKIKCDITVNQRYKIDSVFYSQDTFPMTHVLRDMFKIDFLKSGEYFQRKNVIKDRDAFVEAAHNNGYPFVSAEDILFFVDTTKGNFLVDVHMQIKPVIETFKYERHKYGSIYINPNFSLENDVSRDTSNTIKKEKYNIHKGYDFLKEKALNKAIYIQESTIYNKSKSTITTNRLLNMGLFKFVNVKTQVNPDNTIDHFFNLTPYKMESLSVEFDLNNRSGIFLGTTAKAAYVNKNLFGGAERFEFSLSGGVETQLSKPFVNTIDLAVEASLIVPSIVLPFKAFKTFRTSLPKTIMSVGFNFQDRFEYYSYISGKAKYGWQWNETALKSSSLVLPEFQWFKLLSSTPEFDDILKGDPRLRLSFETTVALGWSYEYIYNIKDKYNPVNQLYFKGTLESSGNLIYLVNRIFSKQPTRTLFKIPYSQYLRLTLDFRKYWALKIGSIASRLVLGTAFAFGVESEIPYAKQYSVGGSNDLRAFPLRGIGPGSFSSTSPSITQFLDQTGDIKIEANVEYRFPIYKFLKGALFIDAGNVWLYESTAKPNGVFKFDSFYDQIAVGTGFSLRFDVDYFLLRAFLAFPIRTIKDNNNFGWVFNEIDLTNSSWRSKNLQYNIGIGYPF